jgi:hypothetical protein
LESKETARRDKTRLAVSLFIEEIMEFSPFCWKEMIGVECIFVSDNLTTLQNVVNNISNEMGL